MSKVILTWSHIKISKQKLCFDLKYPEMTTPKEEVRLQVPLSPSQCALLLPKNPLLFLIGPFIFHTCPFVFQKCLLFISQKCLFVFQNYPLVFQKRLLFIYSEHLFLRMRFFLLLVPFAQVRGAYKDDICLALVLRPFGTLYRPTCDSLLITLIPLHGVWFFMHYVPKKHYGPFLWIGFNCLIASVTSRRQFTASNLVQRNRKGGNNTIHPCTPTRLEVSGI